MSWAGAAAGSCGAARGSCCAKRASCCAAPDPCCAKPAPRSTSPPASITIAPSANDMRCMKGAVGSGGSQVMRTAPSFSSRSASLNAAACDRSSTMSPLASTQALAPYAPLPIGIEPAASSPGEFHCGSWRASSSSAITARASGGATASEARVPAAASAMPAATPNRRRERRGSAVRGDLWIMRASWRNSRHGSRAPRRIMRRPVHPQTNCAAAGPIRPTAAPNDGLVREVRSSLVRRSPRKA